MKHNVQEVASLQPRYLGFIFYNKSPRNFESEPVNIPKHIKKVGVFVDASEQFIKEKINSHQLDILQLHGEESSLYCEKLKKDTHCEIWKVFSIQDYFDFSLLAEYEPIVDKFLFDTKGPAKGGNGYAFDWSLLEQYPCEVPIVISGGIGLESLPKLRSLLASDLPIEVIDLNSKFESKPGLKNIEALKKFIHEL